ncbi:hypothetical protein [Microbacterium sp. NPDC087665]|uniref:hypothetical protein n=1 Tax=Microbacterium sp. NPDC087665 TaxID=3364194 RepID=UPI00380B86D7
MDHYFHGVVLDRAVDIMVGRAAPGTAASKVGMSFEAVRQMIGAATPADLELVARTHVSQRLSLETFQKPDDIGTALALVGVPKVWSSVFGTAAGPTKVALGVVVTRRNRIVHQADSDPLTPGAATPLSDADALDAINSVASVVQSIDSYL